MNKELNINYNNLDFGTDNLSDTSDANDSTADEPITVKDPVIQIRNVESSIEPNNSALNNLDRPSLSNQKLKDNQSHSSNKTLKASAKAKSKSKSKEKSAKVKSKFSETTLEFMSEELKGRIFSGWVGEREFVDNLRAYRDIVEVDEWEDDLNSKLKIVMHGIKGVMEGTKWINITVPSVHTPCYCLWVLMDSTPRPGHYWMKIEDITSDPMFGLKIDLKIIREVNAFDGETKEERERRQKGDLSPDEWKEWALSLMNFNLNSLFSNTLTLLTPSNIGNGFRLVVVLTVTLVVACVTFMRHSWEFLLRFLREFGIFVHHATPFAQSIIRFFEKVVGGFYLLVAMVYKDLRRPNGPPPCSYPMGPRPLSLGPPKPRSPITAVAFVPANNWKFQDEEDASE